MVVFFQGASNPRPLPQPPTSARSQASRPTSGDTLRTNVSNIVSVTKPATPITSTTTVYNEMPQSWSTQSTKHKDELKTNVSYDVMTSKPATPIVSSNTNLQQSQAILSTNKKVANADLGRVIAAPTVQRQLLADQTFSNKDGYKRTVLTVSNGTADGNSTIDKNTCDIDINQNDNSITKGVVHSNRVNSAVPSAPKSSIPRPGAGKEQNQSSTQNSELSEKPSQVKTVKQIMPFSNGLNKTGRSLTSSHLSIKPPVVPNKDATLKVRSLNYTPTKPYSEVSEPGSPTSERAPCSGTNSTCSSPQPQHISMYVLRIFCKNVLPIYVTLSFINRLAISFPLYMST